MARLMAFYKSIETTAETGCETGGSGATLGELALDPESTMVSAQVAQRAFDISMAEVEGDGDFRDHSGAMGIQGFPELLRNLERCYCGRSKLKVQNEN